MKGCHKTAGIPTLSYPRVDIMFRLLSNTISENKYLINPYRPTAKLNDLNFHLLEVVSRYRDPQLQVDENYSHLFNLRLNI